MMSLAHGLECWKCCMFPSYFESSSCPGKLCFCNENRFCYDDYECGDGLYCSRPNQTCVSCLKCNRDCPGKCNGINASMSEDEAFKRLSGFGVETANKHSFYWNCSRSNRGVLNNIGCPCPCIPGTVCIKGVFGRAEDIILTGGVVNGVCQACPEGYVCSGGGNGSNICSAGYYCPIGASIMIPCPEGYYCPEKTVQPQTCNYAGVYKGNICKLGSKVGNTLCPGGYYCPNTSTEIVCPAGTFCRGQNIMPRECPVLTSCQVGSVVPSGYSGVVWIVVGSVFLLGILYWGWCIWKKRYDGININMGRSVVIQVHNEDRVKIHEIRYQNMSVGTWLADNSGVLKGGRLNAIMGSSGCGKSTLIELMRGRIEEKDLVTGYVDVVFENGRKIGFDPKGSRELGIFRKLVGFVPQDDLVFGDLTVKENLYYSHSLKRKEDDYIVDKVLLELGLMKIANKIVGYVGKRGISGGQKKRVNIGMELVGLHSLIFMDEPTSGLDSTGSYEVLKFLKTLEGITFVCVIHQPRFSSFMLFDHLTLLGKNGCVFMGSSSASLAYFSLCLGCRINHNDNPGDAIMDIITYGFKYGGEDGKESKHVDASDLHELWISKGGIEWVNEYNKICGDDLVEHSDFSFNELIEDAINQHTVYDCYQLIMFFEKYGDGLVVSWKDAKAFIGHEGFITSAEFKHRWKEICSERALIEAKGGNTWLSIIQNIICIRTPKSILFNVSIDRWKKLRIDSIVLQFLNKLRGHRVWVGRVRSRNELEKEILYTTLKMKMKKTGGVLCQQYSRNGEVISTEDLGNTIKTWIRQSGVLMMRRGVSFLRSPWFVQLCVTMAAALIVGAIHGANWDISGFNGNIVMAMACIGVLGMVTHVRTFTVDKDVMSREIKNGLPLTLCISCYMWMDMIWIFLLPALFFIIYWYMTFPAANLGWFILTGIMVEWWISGMAYIISFMSIGVAWVNLVGVFISIIFGAFINGLNPSIADVKGTIGEVLLGLSYNRWALEIMAIQEMNESWDVKPETVLSISSRMGFCDISAEQDEWKQKLNIALMIIRGESYSVVCSDSVALAFGVLAAEGAAFRIFAWAIYWLGWNGFSVKNIKRKIVCSRHLQSFHQWLSKMMIFQTKK